MIVLERQNKYQSRSIKALKLDRINKLMQAMMPYVYRTLYGLLDALTYIISL